MKIAVFTLIACGMAWAQSPISFDAPPRDHATLVPSNAGAVGDFNGDGKMDIAAIGDGSISVLPGNGDGTFKNRVTSEITDQGYLAVVAGDFNGDGILDLAATAQPSGIQIFLGQGNGVFSQQPLVPCALSSSLVSDDFNGDGKLDLAVATSTNITILLGQGNGTFAPAAYIPVPSSGLRVVSGDFNQDGIIDLAEESNSPTKNLSILLGAGDGTFTRKSIYTTDIPMGPLAVGDLNGDGKPDLLAISNERLALFAGNGDGTLQAPAVVPAPQLDASIALADFNGDGKLDIAVFTTVQTAFLLIGDGLGGFTQKKSASLGYIPTSLLIADFNGDGLPDLATAESSTAYVSVLFTEPGGNLARPPVYSSGIPSEPQDAIAVDVNNDGKLDVVAASSAGTISVLLGNGQSESPLDTAVTIALPGAAPVAVASADFNGDGFPDLAVADNNGSIRILLGKGDGSFQSGTSIAVSGHPGSIAIGDFNGDGVKDLVTGDQSSSAFYVYLGKGNGEFATAAAYHVPNYATSVTAADFNNDGRSDVVVSEGELASVPGGGVLFLSNPDGALQAPITITNASQFQRAAVADVNGDGNMDITFQALGGQFFEFLGNGNGTFQSPKYFNANPESYHFVLADLNGDGNLDFASVGAASNAICVIPGHGNGAFSFPINYGTGLDPLTIVAGDFNGDGKIDLITLQNSNFELGGILVPSASYSVLLNTQ